MDVAASEAALQYMKRSNNNGSTDGRAKEVPQLFVGGEFRGVNINCLWGGGERLTHPILLFVTAIR